MTNQFYLLLGEGYKKEVEKQLACNIQLFGKEGNQKICDAFVIVVGIGGVGRYISLDEIIKITKSHVLSALARAGVRKIRIIDFDRISLSSLNRHAFATRENVGIAKVIFFILIVQEVRIGDLIGDFFLFYVKIY